MNPKLDRRKRYTQMVIRESFIQLLKEKPIEKITVKEICEVADVNRSTFYSHFSDAYAVLEAISTELMTKFRHTLVPTPDRQEVKVEEIFNVIYENRALCAILLGKNGDIRFLTDLLSIGQKSAYQLWNLDKNIASETMITFVSMGSVGVIRAWIDGGMTQSPKEIATLVEKMTYTILSGLQ